MAIKILKDSLQELITYRPVMWQLVSQIITLRYRRTLMGYLWTLVNPLLMMGILAFVFSALFGQDVKTFAMFLFAGLIPWNFFSSAVSQSSTAFLQNEGLIKKIYLPKLVFPITLLAALFFDSILAFIALFLIVLLIGGSVNSTLVFLPIAYVLLFVFTLGISLIVSVITVYFRDLQHVVTVAIQGLFFLTPVIYKPEAIAERAPLIVWLNPLVPFIELFRAPLYYSKFPELSTIVASLGLAVVSMVVGVSVFLNFEKKLIFRL
jgi:ABC-type polysaccharide/polyol phosphate export permease